MPMNAVSRKQYIWKQQMVHEEMGWMEYFNTHTSLIQLYKSDLNVFSDYRVFQNWWTGLFHITVIIISKALWHTIIVYKLSFDHIYMHRQ